MTPDRAPLRVWKSRQASAWFVDCAMCTDDGGEQVFIGDSQEDALYWAQRHWHEHNPYGEPGALDRTNVVEFPINYQM